jgi:guanosine-3',5'-bis(diphosphate) 3'-pyrophosphohydrolase
MNSFALLQAMYFAERAHRGQVRKYTGDPYISHPLYVATIVASVPNISMEAVVAAILHDCDEDTSFKLDAIRRVFGKKVATLVNEVTERSVAEDGNRATRKAIDLAHYAKASPDGQTIKVADLIANSESIILEDPGFSEEYIPEKRKLLRALKKADKGLRERAWGLIRQWESMRNARDRKNWE